MTSHHSRVTIHLAVSLDGFIARRDGRVDRLDAEDEFPDGATLDAEAVEASLPRLDCCLKVSRTHEAADAQAVEARPKVFAKRRC